MPCVLLHDVDTATLDQLRAQLPPSHELIRVQDAPEGLKVSAQLLVVTERTLDDADGAVGELHDARPGAPLVVLAPLGRMDLAVRAMRAGAFDVLPDPVDARLLGITVERAVEQGALLQELRRYRAERTRGQKGGLLGNSPAMRQVDRLIDRMAPVASSAMIRLRTYSSIGTNPSLSLSEALKMPSRVSGVMYRPLSTYSSRECLPSPSLSVKPKTRR